jgi:phosphatidylserine/phosphatidylglycerophosphate/cardiolipin synthase-like enzyme
LDSNKSVPNKICILGAFYALILTGSFNWTKNANDNNFEDLTVSHQEAIVMGYCNIFESLWQLTSEDFAMLCNSNICNYCGELRFINNEFFTIHVYQNLIGILDKFSDEREYCEMNDPMDEEKENTKFDYAINNYLSQVRRQRMGMPIIHAVGLYGQRVYHGNVEERFIQVLWKERYTSRFVLDEYPLE